MVSCNYVACRRTHIFKAYVNQLPSNAPSITSPRLWLRYRWMNDNWVTKEVGNLSCKPSSLSLSLLFPLFWVLCLMKFTRVSSFMLDVGFTLQGSIHKSIRSQVFPERLYVFWEWKFIEPLENWKPKTVFLGQEFDVFWHETEASL